MIALLKDKFTSKLAQNFTKVTEIKLMTNFLAKINFDKVLLQSAQRKPYGEMPRHHDLYADETADAIWSWELASPSLYLEPPAYLRDVLQHRDSMQSLANLIHSL